MQHHVAFKLKNYIYNSESITKRRVGENGRMFGILFAHAEHELMEQYETIHKEFNIKS